jgi:hypothetical protein
VSGSAIGSPGSAFLTSAGPLQFTPSDTGTFQATLQAASVPEPSSLVLASIGGGLGLGIGIAWLRRHRP